MFESRQRVHFSFRIHVAVKCYLYCIYNGHAYPLWLFLFVMMSYERLDITIIGK